MKTWVRKSLKAGVLAAGLLLFAGSAASANVASDWDTQFQFGIANGNQIAIPVQVPIDVCGNAVGIIGNSIAGCRGGASASIESTMLEESGWGDDRHGDDRHGDGGSGSDWVTAFNFGALNGNQIYVPVQVPIDICGNAIAVIGNATAGCQGGAFAKIESGKAESGKAESAQAQNGKAESARVESTRVESGSDWFTGFNFGIANGNQIYVPIQVPINVCGNAIGVIGNATASCRGGAAAHIESASVSEGVASDWTSAFNFGLLNGNQVAVPIQVPINVCGNAISLIGNTRAGCMGGASARIGDDRDHDMRARDDQKGHDQKRDDQKGYDNKGHDNKGHDNKGDDQKGYDNKGHKGYGDDHKGDDKGHGQDGTWDKKAGASATVGTESAHVTEGLPLVGDLLGGMGGGAMGGDRGGYDDHGQGDDHGKGDDHGRDRDRDQKRCFSNWTTAFNLGALNGNQLAVPVQVPIDVSGNAIGIIGNAQAMSMGGASASIC